MLTTSFRIMVERLIAGEPSENGAVSGPAQRPRSALLNHKRAASPSGMKERQMAWTDRGNLAARDAVQAPHSDPLDELLVSGGDHRLAPSATSENAYGCTPFPAPGRIDFASSTASTISAEGHARARAAREQLLIQSMHWGPDAACEAAVT